MEAISPVVRGLINGFSLGNMVQQHQMDQQRMASHERQQRFQNEQVQANLLTQLAELGARPVTQSDQYEVQGGQHVNFNEGLPITGGSSITSTPTDLPARILSMPGTGQQFVLPSAAERDQRAAAYNQRTLLDRNRAHAEQVAQELKLKEEAAARNLETTGIPLPAALLKRFDMKPGAKVLPTQMDDLLRADSYARSVEKPAAAKKVIGTPSRFSAPGGALMERVHYSDGTFEDRAINGTPVVRPSSGAGRRTGGAKEDKPTFTQKVTMLTEKVLQDSAQGKGTSIEDAISNVDKFYQNDPQFSPSARQMVKSRLRAMAKKDGPNNPFFKADAPAPAAGQPAAPATRKVATMDNVKAYAAKAGKTEAQAIEDFKKSGYTVQ